MDERQRFGFVFGLMTIVVFLLNAVFILAVVWGIVKLVTHFTG